MLKSVRILLSVLLCGAIANAFAVNHSFAEQVGDTTYWQTLDWSKAETSAAWLDRNWVSYLGKQDSAESREKIQALILAGTEWQATLSERKNSKGAPWQITIYSPGDDQRVDRCDSLYHWALKRFGSPRIAVDGSYRQAATTASMERQYIDRHYQWDVGTTRITQDCTGQQTTKDTSNAQNTYAACSLRFSQKTATPELPPLVNAKCTRVLRLTDSSDIPLKMSDIAFVIDESNGAIRRPDLVPIRVRNVSVSPDEVRFSLTLDKSNNDYQIERPSGILSATMSIAGIRAGSVTGQCMLTPILTAQPE